MDMMTGPLRRKAVEVQRPPTCRRGSVGRDKTNGETSADPCGRFGHRNDFGRAVEHDLGRAHPERVACFVVNWNCAICAAVNPRSVWEHRRSLPERYEGLFLGQHLVLGEVRRLGLGILRVAIGGQDRGVDSDGGGGEGRFGHVDIFIDCEGVGGTVLFQPGEGE